MSTTVPEAPALDAALRTAGVPVGLAEEEREIGLFDFLIPLVRQRRIVVGLPLAVTVLAIVVSLLLPSTYTATTTFVPETRPQVRLPQGLAGFAGQFGITLPQETRESPRFYAQILRSRQIMDRVLLTRFAVSRPERGGPDSLTLLALLKVRGRNSADSLEKGFRKLDQDIAVNVDPTSVVSLRVEARDPGLAAAVANRFIAYLNEFNTQYRGSQAGARRRFVERRVADAEAELRRAESAVETFHQHNRGWQESPSLVFREAELRRQVTIGQDVYLTLRREYETARIEEVNDTPVITVIDAALPPQRRSWPKRRTITLLALVVASMVGCVWAYGADYVSRLRGEQDAGYREFTALLRQARQDLSRAFPRRLRRAKF